MGNSTFLPPPVDCCRYEVTVTLVDDNEVTLLHNPSLDPLELVAPGRREEEAEHVHHVPHLVLALTHPHRLHQHHVVAAGLHQQDGLVGVPGDAAQVSAGGAGPDEGSRVPGQLRNPGLVAQNTAWRETLSEIGTK